MNTEPWINAQEAADYIGRTLNTLYELTSRGEIKHYGGGRGGRRLMFRQEWLDDYIALYTREVRAPADLTPLPRVNRHKKSTFKYTPGDKVAII